MKEHCHLIFKFWHCSPCACNPTLQLNITVKNIIIMLQVLKSGGEKAVAVRRTWEGAPRLGVMLLKLYCQSLVGQLLRLEL